MSANDKNVFVIEGSVPHDVWAAQAAMDFDHDKMRVKRMDPWRLRQRHADLLMDAVREAGRHLNMGAINFIRNRKAHA
jgi:hypothetical protein